MEKILIFGAICPFWASFRQPQTVNVHVTYPIPPPSTLYGMLNAARGKPQDWNADRDNWQISLIVESKGTFLETFSKIFKPARKDRGKDGLFDRTILMRQKLVKVHYTIYLKTDESLLVEAQQALNSPHWPLYLGESDDVVDIVNPRIVECQPEEVLQVHSIIPGFVEGGQLVKVPTHFIEPSKKQFQGRVSYTNTREQWQMHQQFYSIP
ncbi:CRISPR-associated protein Cas5, partial [Candidatus Poribacteria bacterium]|nr:CRISPR-associated protein Cas5 [Candidatus Poribacteria bacterium]